jgi:hypothetical protein
MAGCRFRLVLPVLAVLICSALWFWARVQYLRFLCPPSGLCPDQWGLVAWTDYTPPALQIAGALNVPIASFAAPLYRLMQGSTHRWELVLWALAILVQWFLVGWALDMRGAPPPRRTLLRVIAGAVGCLFALFLLLVNIPMFHVGIVYKAASVLWALALLRHFGQFLRKSFSRWSRGITGASLTCRR